MATAGKPSDALEFTEEQNRTVKTLSLALAAAGGILMLLAAGWAVLGGAILWKYFAGSTLPNVGFWRGALHLVEAGLAFLLGNVLLTASQDFGYIVTTHGHDRKHLQNGVTSLKVFNYFLLGLGVVVALHVTCIAAGWI